MIHLLLQAGGAEDKLDIVSLIVHASSVAKGTLMLLALMSIVLDGFFIGTKWLYLARQRRPLLPCAACAAWPVPRSRRGTPR